MIYKRFVRPKLFRKDPEEAHEDMLNMLEDWQKSKIKTAAMRALFIKRSNSLKQHIFGLNFHNPVGMAPGFDKNGRVVNALESLGFGFVEVGTVTARPQTGNQKPRIFRLEKDMALINRLGFNSDGAKAVAENLKASPPIGIPIGINIGKNADVPLDKAAENYVEALRAIYSYGDFIVINVSSPNTEDLRELQLAKWLESLISLMQKENKALSQRDQTHKKPLLVKIAPDLTMEQLEETAGVIQKHADGIIVCNTTVSREGLTVDPNEQGGLSGRPLRKLSTQLVAKVYRLTHGKVPIIGVGGIFDSWDAYEKIIAGASLVQVYTGMIYEGPFIARAINAGLLRLMAKDGIKEISAAVGSKNKMYHDY